jgi:penicillin-binding protein 2
MASAEDRRRLTTRLRGLHAGVFVLFGGLVVFWFFQVVQHASSSRWPRTTTSARSRCRRPEGCCSIARRGPRREPHAFNISIVPRAHPRPRPHHRAARQVTGVDEAHPATVERQRRLPPYRPSSSCGTPPWRRSRPSWPAARLELPDVVVEEVPTREYPAEALAAHLIGYVGEASDPSSRDEGFRHRRDRRAVRGGARLQPAPDGRGRRPPCRGQQRRPRNRTLEEQPPTKGSGSASPSMPTCSAPPRRPSRHYGYWGSAVALEPSVGRRAGAHQPARLRPQRVCSTGIDRATWAGAQHRPLRPLQNRAIQGRYSPGSTFKVAVAVAGSKRGGHARNQGVLSGRRLFLRPILQVPSRRRSRLGGHAPGAREVVQRVLLHAGQHARGRPDPRKWSSALGLGEKSGIDLPNEVAGHRALHRWKRERMGEKWYAGETISVAIGQGQVSVTPISLAVMMATVANGGTRHVPHLVGRRRGRRAGGRCRRRAVQSIRR